jgi:methyl-accepting chemotaxis protein
MTRPEGTRARGTGLLGRMVLSSIVPAALLLALIVGVNAYRKHGLLLEDAEQRLSLQAEALAAWLESLNLRSVDVTDALRATETELFGDRTRSMAVTRGLIDSAPWITGSTVAYEPDADGGDAASAGKDGNAPGGRFIPYWFRDWRNADRISLKLLSGMDTDEWYVGPARQWRERRSTDPIVTEPYDYEGKLMVTYGAPIVSGDRLVGVVGVDVGLETIEAEVARRAAAAGVDIYLISPKERIVVASDGTGREFASDPSSWRVKMLSEVPGGEDLAAFARRTDAGAVEARDDANARDRSFFATARIPTGGWTLVMAVPESTVTGPIVADLAVSGTFSMLGVGLLAAIIFVPTRRLVRRVNEAAASAQRVAAGDLTGAPSGSTAPDESGELLRALDSMTSDLNSLVGQVRGAAVELTSTATELAATARRQDEVVASFGASSSQIAAAVRQIDATTTELSREMEHVNDVAASTSRMAQDGRVQLETMEGAMQTLDGATAGIADRLAAINEKAVNIGGVVTTITKVAEQTNLLSVNAAIEAEKAGEYGRGFLVVAREIRRLADQTGQATLDIERMVKEMQGAVSSGVMEMDRFSDQVRRNVADVRAIGRSMTDIIGSVDETGRSFGAVREGMRSQAAGAGQISDAMASLSGNAKATAEAVREFGRAAEDLQRSIGTLRTAIAAFQLRN